MCSGDKQLYDVKAQVPVDPNKPCFTHYCTGCDGKCGGYNHDESAIEKLAFKSLEDIVMSHYVGEERATDNMKNFIQTIAMSKSTTHEYLSPILEMMIFSNFDVIQTWRTSEMKRI